MHALAPLLAAIAFLAAVRLDAETRSSIAIPVWADSPASLAPSGLKAGLDGKPAKVLRVCTPKDDLLLLVVFDLVGDIALVDPARNRVISLIESLPPTTYMALLRAQDGLQVVLDPTADREALVSGVRALPIGGRPALLETVEQAAGLADRILTKAAIRLALIYITDSNIYDYREDYTNPVVNSSDSRDLSRRFPEGLIREKISKIDASLSALQAPLFIAHLSYQRDRLNEAYQTGLLQLAQTTGGTAVFCRTISEIPDAIQRVFDRAMSHWRVDVQLPERPRRNILVQLEGEANLSYRTRYQMKRK